MKLSDFTQTASCQWVLERKHHKAMNADAVIFASEEIMRSAIADASIEQVIHVASLPGIVGHSMAMPDIHYGYGFCIGGVAAFPADDGIVSPGGVGYDINCGVRLLATRIPVDELRQRAEDIGYAVLRRIPTGLTDRSNYKLDKKEFFRLLHNGAAEVVRNYGGNAADLEYIESGGSLPWSDEDSVSVRAVERGDSQVGSLGSGNHFIEIQAVEEIFDAEAAAAFGVSAGHAAIMIHTGSRGFGHQIATDYIELLRRKHLPHIRVADPQLVYAPIASSEGRRYLQALHAAANFAWANRQLLQEDLTAIFEQHFHASRQQLGIRLVYDQAHNIAKFERHTLGGEAHNLLVHRKGATRAFPPGAPEIPAAYRPVGQPVILPGSMGSGSFLLKGTQQAMEVSFGSSAHGAGRRMSRHEAIKFSAGRDVRDHLKAEGILVFSLSNKGLREEIPEAYKAIDSVVDVTERAGISCKVARMRPLVVVKG